MADDPDFEYVMIDSTIVRAHQHAAGKEGGRLVRSRYWEDRTARPS
jgi:putative transposase